MRATPIVGKPAIYGWAPLSKYQPPWQHPIFVKERSGLNFEDGDEWSEAFFETKPPVVGLSNAIVLTRKTLIEKDKGRREAACDIGVKGKI